MEEFFEKQFTKFKEEIVAEVSGKIDEMKSLILDLEIKTAQLSKKCSKNEECITELKSALVTYAI